MLTTQKQYALRTETAMQGERFCMAGTLAAPTDRLDVRARVLGRLKAL